MFFGTLVDIDGLGRTLADSDGHWRTQTDSCCKGEACLPRSHNKREPLSPKSYVKNSHKCLSANVLSFFIFYDTTDLFFVSLADIDGHLRGTLESEKIFSAYYDNLDSMKHEQK